MPAACPCLLGNEACLGSRSPCHGDVRQVLSGLPLPGLGHRLSVGCGLGQGVGLIDGADSK